MIEENFACMIYSPGPISARFRTRLAAFAEILSRLNTPL